MNNVFSLQYATGNVPNAIWTNNGQLSQPNCPQQQIQAQFVPTHPYTVQQIPFQVQQMPIHLPYGQMLQSNINQLRIPLNSNFVIASQPLQHHQTHVQNYQQPQNQHLQQQQVQEELSVSPSPVPRPPQQQYQLPQSLQVPQQMSPILHQPIPVQKMSPEPELSEPRSVDSAERMSPVLLTESNSKQTSESNRAEESLTSIGVQVKYKERTPGSGRKFQAICNPKLTLKTPIAFDKKNDPAVIPILKDGMGVCESCGAIGVKDSFYSKSRKFCSMSCSRNYSSMIENHQKTILSKLAKDQEQQMDSSSIYADFRFEFESSEAATSAMDAFENGTVGDHDEDGSNGSVDGGNGGVSGNNTSEYLIDDPLPVIESPFDLPDPVDRIEVVLSKTASQAAKKRLNDSYSWDDDLSDRDFRAASVSCFRHAPGFDVWDTVLPGVKVEVNTTEMTDYNENVIWVATIIKVFGYKALLRYEGMEKISMYDFWLSLVSPRIHYVGWAASKGKSLTPPKCLLDTNTDWRSFLTKRLTNSTTLPVHFFMKINESMKTRFAVGQHVEIIDKTRLSVIRMAVVREIIGKRLHVVYTDGDDDDDDYWCHEDSPNLHPVGWAQKVGHPVFAPSLYSSRASSKKNDQNAAPESSFRVYQIGTNMKLDANSDIKVGMKLEVLDPWNIAFMGVATVKKLLKFGFLMISVDTYDVQKEVGSDWYCYHIHSPYVFPVGYCEQNELPLHPPFTYENTTFRWNDYLRNTHSLPVPQSCFKKWSQINHRFSTNMKIEAVDLMTPKLVCVATIAEVKGRHLKITFDGWGDDYDQWIDCSSPEIYPVGWCEVAGYRLESPRSKESASSTNDDSMSSNGNGNGNVSNATSRSSNSQSVSQSKKKRGRKRKNVSSGMTTATMSSMATAATGAVTRAVSSASPSLAPTTQPNRTQSPMLTSQSSATSSTGVARTDTSAHVSQPPLLVPLTKKPNVLPTTASTTLPLKRPSSVLSNGNDSLSPSVPLTRSQLKSSDSMLSRTMKTYSSASAVNHHQQQHQHHNNINAARGSKGISSDEDAATLAPTNATTSADAASVDKPFIPCFLNRTLTGSEESLLNPESWTCENVSEYLKINNCASYADAFVTHEIEGSVFLTMSYDDIRLVTNNKAGPSLKIRELIDKLNRIKSLRKIKNK